MPRHDPSHVSQAVAQVVVQFEQAWHSGQVPRIEDFLKNKTGLNRRTLLVGLLHADLDYRLKAGQSSGVEEYLARFPELESHAEDVVELILAEFGWRRRLGHYLQVEGYVRRFPRYQDQLAQHLAGIGDTRATFTPTGQATPVEIPEEIGRYRIDNLLGEGGFGVVYQAFDDRLSRAVAIKVPHARMLAQPGAAEAYLTEARIVGNLDHPHIVPVYDAGSTEQFPCFIVSKLMDGGDLMAWTHTSRPSLQTCASLVATIAEALHHAHKHNLVHRDIKPGNILMDHDGQPSVADFGLALREQDVGKGPGYIGTPAYMSPEQARGEGHRVDCRSDIFSLGIVFYELLTRRPPFKAESIDKLLEQIGSLEPRPPRQFDDRIPRELDRICLKALAKRASERYPTARDMAEDLLHFLANASAEEKSARTGRETRDADVATPLPAPTTPPTSDGQPIKIVPKGLRSFDATDADFFLDLLPGPRDRDGLPDSMRFWKTRIEAADPDRTFSVGLIYGPSGCGKSSLMKAGLLPRFAKAVTAVYVEATGEETEARLLKGVRRQVPNLATNLGLIESLAALRRGRFLEPGQKVLLVLDQFEQWLHAKRNEENTELVQALRQCDGGRLQAIVMVRDDFWLAVSRFMQALEIVPDEDNSRLVDLFDGRHAKKVLSAFGRAFGALPEKELTREQDAFLDQAVSGLAQDGKVFSVRLALFAEMVKGKPWTPGTLKAVGGTHGVGVAFLEETFTASTAPPQHRLHQKAAQAVLKALLPESGTDIKGYMRSQQELLNASGYASRPRDFADLLRILDNELRLITPTDLEAQEDFGEPRGASPRVADCYYQLTHDYLVPSLRDWLTRKQKETRRGRAELLLADRAAVWSARPENRQLPSLLQWLQIRRLTAKKHWTPPQRKMMSTAGRYHALRALVVAVALGLLGWGVYEVHGSLQAHALRDRLLDANISDVPTIVTQMKPYRRWLGPLLPGALHHAQISHDAPRQLRARLALLRVDDSQVTHLYGRLLDAQPQEVPVIRDALMAHQDGLRDQLWAVVAAPGKGKESRRLRAAAALAKYDPWSQKWATAGALVVNSLVQENAVFLGQWSDTFQPVKHQLLTPLAAVFRDRHFDHAAERTLATNLLADYAADDGRLLANLLMDADEKQFAVIYPRFKDQSDQGLPALIGEIDKKLPSELPSSNRQREAVARRQANAAVALLRMGRPERVWPLLGRSKEPDDPRARSYLSDRLSSYGTDASMLLRQLDEERDMTIRRALLLSLGEFSETELPPTMRAALLPKLEDIYRTHPDSGLHGAAEWLLRQWGQHDRPKSIDHQLRTREADLEATINGTGSMRRWYINGEGQTFVVIPGPVEFVMGSPITEADRNPDETQHKKRIGRTFALAAKSVTVGQYRQFDNGYQLPVKFTRLPDLPVVGTAWYMAAAYCNWLSKVEGIDKDQWCYETDSAGKVIRMKANYLHLSGYRLPTEAEMEYATRAGAVTSRYYGEAEELLPKYAWYLKNAEENTWPVGSKKPNDLGFFDMQGNVFTWCQERYLSYPPSPNETYDDTEDIPTIKNETGRVLRGGSFSNRASSLRSAYRINDVPANRYLYMGLRPARTLPLTPQGGGK
jgi:serine/threonine protein kinase/formylglycine-generating enzyme required for sulfatase activity